MTAQIRSRISPGMWQSLALITAVTFAYALDYLFNLTTGRLLSPVDFSIFVALAGVLHVVVVGSRVIQTVTARYVSRFQANLATQERIAPFFQAMFRAAWFWGIVAMAVMFALTPLLADFLRIEQRKTVFLVGVTVLLMVVRPVVDGTLQGEQQFAAFGGVQITQSVMRLLLGAVLMLAGWGAFGAVLSLPLGSTLALMVGLWALDGSVKRKTAVSHQVNLPDIFRYSGYTAVGLISLAVMLNMDAILARRFFDPAQAGNYSAAVTLGKVIQFFPVAVIMILFSKSAKRQAVRQNSARLLLLAMLVVVLFSGGVAVLYALFPEQIMALTLGDQYEVDGRLLGLVGAAMLFLSLVNVWLNYFLSIDWTHYVYFAVVGVLVQGGLMAFFHAELWHLPAAMVVTGVCLTLVGGLIFVKQQMMWRSREKGKHGGEERR